MRAFLLLLALPTLLLTACNSSSGDAGSAGLPRATNAPGVLMIVAPDALYNSKVGEELQNVFAKAIAGLPQPEPQFDLQQVSPSNFATMMRLAPNILVLEHDPNQTKGFTLKRDVYARKQVVAYLYYDTVDDIITAIREQGPGVVDALNNAEWARLIGKFATVPETSVMEEVKTQYGMDLTLPKDFRLALSRPSFAWLRLEKSRPSGATVHPVDQGIMVWYTPYTDTSQFTMDALMAARDSITRRYIPGPNDGSYMAISHRAWEPEVRTIAFNDRYTVEMRGLWRVENGFMGGPFMSITTLDTKNSRLITIDGYVFAPEFDKREYLREVEAIIKSARFVNS